MSISNVTRNEPSLSPPPSQKISFLIRQFTTTMINHRRKKPTKVHALTPTPIPTQPHISKPHLPYGLPNLHQIEPPIDPNLTHVDFVDQVSNLYNRIMQSDSDSERCRLYLEKYAMLSTVGDPKVVRRCLQSANTYAVDVHWKAVLSAWLRYEMREDELVQFDITPCVYETAPEKKIYITPNNYNTNYNKDDEIVHICIGSEVIRCARAKIASLSIPLNTLLYGSFIESVKGSIDFTQVGISKEAMRGVEVFSRTKKIVHFSSPTIVLEILSFSNKFCCEEMKHACEVYLSSLVSNIDDALVFIECACDSHARVLVASCLQVLLRNVTSLLHNPKVLRFFCCVESMERLRMVGHASFVLYYYLTQVAIDEKMTSSNVVMLFERLTDFATETWQKAVAFHRLGVLLFEKKEYKRAESFFNLAYETGHVYSATGMARSMYKQGKTYLARDFINKNLIDCDKKPSGWMYQERSLYTLGSKKIQDLELATKLDPTLSYPYKYRAVSMISENLINEAIEEISKIIRFKVSPDCLELRAWFYLVIEDFEGAVRDMRALLSLEPCYMMFHGKMSCDYLVDLLSQRVKEWTPADCWMQLYERWSCIDDIGSLAVIHQMMDRDPGKSVLRFRQPLLLLRLNCQKAAMRSLRLARNLATTNHERLVYEGWILYDTGYREEALSKAEESISLQRSFEAYFLKAYTLADASVEPDSSSVIQLLVDALKCPSDGLRKGQALNNLGSIYVDCGKYDLAADCYVNALDIKHTRAHQGLARVYSLKDERKAAYDEMTKLIEKAENNASAYEKRSEYCDRDNAMSDLCIATQLDPLRTYPYRYRAAVLMDEQKETEVVEELTKAIAFKPELQMLHLRAAFYESMSDYNLALRDCEAALCLDPTHKETLELYNRTQKQAAELYT